MNGTDTLGWKGWLLPSRIAGIAVLVSIPARLMIDRLADPDLWWHLRTGALIASERSIPTTDVYSYTATGASWTVQEWGAELLLHWIRETAGLWGIHAFRALVLFAVYAIVARIIVRRMGAGLSAWILVGITAYAGASNWTERPNLLSFLLFAVTLDLIDRRSERAVVWFVPLAALWANLHGMVLVGLGTLALAAVLEWIRVGLHLDPDRGWARRLSVVFAAGVVATMLNPRGPGLYEHAFGLISTVRDAVTEWASPDFHEVGTYAFLILLLATFSAFALLPRRVDLTDLGLAMAFTFLALQARRNLAVSAMVLGIAAARVLPHALRSVMSDTGERPPVRPSVPLGVAGLLALGIGLGAVVADGLPASGDIHDMLEPETYAVDAIDALDREGVRVFAFDRWAPMVIDRAWPRARVFFDTRSDVYGPEGVAAYRETISALPGWDTRLDVACTTHVLIAPRHALNQVLALSDEWLLERSDELSRTYVRADPAPGCEDHTIPSVL